ncbi:hypothetical protein GJAV_G00025390 [Gymnothorax javanicus]|nr:hypothetical protein GJAV_G00025390 [Gymnothorax javanicus]
MEDRGLVTETLDNNAGTYHHLDTEQRETERFHSDLHQVALCNAKPAQSFGQWGQRRSSFWGFFFPLHRDFAGRRTDRSVERRFERRGIVDSAQTGGRKRLRRSGPPRTAGTLPPTLAPSPSPALQHGPPSREALPGPPSSVTMWKWELTKGASAWSHLSPLPLLLVLLVSLLPVACCETRPAHANYSANANSTAMVVGRHVRSYNHLQGDVRRRKLFSFQKFFLRIDRSGKVNGTKSRDDPFSVLEIKSVAVGIVAIRGLASNYYLAMSRKGEVYGVRDYGTDCMLKERIEENGYNTYASAQYKNGKRQMFVGLNVKGKPLKGKKTRRKHNATHFLPIMV